MENQLWVLKLLRWHVSTLCISEGFFFQAYTSMIVSFNLMEITTKYLCI